MQVCKKEKRNKTEEENQTPFVRRLSLTMATTTDHLEPMQEPDAERIDASPLVCLPISIQKLCK